MASGDQKDSAGKQHLPQSPSTTRCLGSLRRSSSDLTDDSVLVAGGQEQRHSFCHKRQRLDLAVQTLELLPVPTVETDS